MTVYVSDLLEDLLDAGRARAAVRQSCLSLLDPLATEVAASLQPLTVYFGGKCMGYPAIWAVSHACGLDCDDEIRLVGKVRSTLFANITTSIVDDIFDRDEIVGVEHLGVLYLLIYGALGAESWSAPIKHRSGETLCTALASARTSFSPDSAKSDRLRTRGERIGAFFALTAAACAEALDLEPRNRDNLVTLLNDLGVLCAHIDDVLDVRRDLEAGNMGNAVLMALADRKKMWGMDWLEFLDTGHGRHLIHEFLASNFDQLSVNARSAGWAALSNALTSTKRRLHLVNPDLAARGGEIEVYMAEGGG